MKENLKTTSIKLPQENENDIERRASHRTTSEEFALHEEGESFDSVSSSETGTGTAQFQLYQEAVCHSIESSDNQEPRKHGGDDSNNLKKLTSERQRGYLLGLSEVIDSDSCSTRRAAVTPSHDVASDDALVFAKASRSRGIPGRPPISKGQMICYLCQVRETAQWRYLSGKFRVCNKCFMKHRKRKNASRSLIIGSRAPRLSQNSFSNGIAAFQEGGHTGVLGYGEDAFLDAKKGEGCRLIHETSRNQYEGDCFNKTGQIFCKELVMTETGLDLGSVGNEGSFAACSVCVATEEPPNETSIIGEERLENKISRHAFPDSRGGGTLPLEATTDAIHGYICESPNRKAMNFTPCIGGTCCEATLALGETYTYDLADKIGSAKPQIEVQDTGVEKRKNLLLCGDARYPFVGRKRGRPPHKHKVISNQGLPLLAQNEPKPPRNLNPCEAEGIYSLCVSNGIESFEAYDLNNKKMEKVPEGTSILSSSLSEILPSKHLSRTAAIPGNFPSSSRNMAAFDGSFFLVGDRKTTLIPRSIAQKTQENLGGKRCKRAVKKAAMQEMDLRAGIPYESADFSMLSYPFEKYNASSKDIDTPGIPEEASGYSYIPGDSPATDLGNGSNGTRVGSCFTSFQKIHSFQRDNCGPINRPIDVKDLPCLEEIQYASEQVYRNYAHSLVQMKKLPTSL